MIDNIISIIDRLIDLLERGKERRRTIFDDHVEPMFVDLTSVHGDYRQAIRQIRDWFRDDKMTDDELLEKIDDRRSDFDYIRKKLKSLTKALRGVPAKPPSRGLKSKRKKAELERQRVGMIHGSPQEIHAFVESVARYFEVGAGAGPNSSVGVFFMHPRTLQSLYTTCLDLLNMVKSEILTRTECSQLIDCFPNLLDNAWGDVTEAYAQARVHCLAG